MLVTIDKVSNQKTWQLSLQTIKSLPGVDSTIVIKETSNSIAILLLGSYNLIDTNQIIKLPYVTHIELKHDKTPLTARPKDDHTNFGFSYMGIDFKQNSLQLIPGFNAVDTIANAKTLLNDLQKLNITCMRMGFMKPRSNPYSFQGIGPEQILPYFKLAVDYGIKVIALEVTHEKQLSYLDKTIASLNNNIGALLQVGTRNSQNFELLKALGQSPYPILYKRGYGISLEESLNAAEYLAAYGNKRIIFCLRGMKSLFADEHRNMVDFSQVAMIKRKTKMPVCIDPSHAIGNLATCNYGIPDIFHVTAQGVISGANMILLDVHPHPQQALVDKQQTLSLNQLKSLVADVKITREAYLARCELLTSKSFVV